MATRSPSDMQLLRWLAWALAIFVIGNAVFIVGRTVGLFGTPPDPPSTTDFVDRLIAFRAFDQSVWPIELAGALLSFGSFLLIALLGPALRPLASTGTARDVMATVLVVAGVLGVVAALVALSAAEQAASLAYCDCGYRAEEVIAQAKALDLTWAVQNWLSEGAVAVVALGAAIAGRIVNVSSAWRLVSYAIAVILTVGVVLRVLGFFQLSDLLVGVGAGIAVPIWAVLLARGARSAEA